MLSRHMIGTTPSSPAAWAAVGPDSAKLTAWFASMVNGVKPTTMEITALTIRNQEVASWSLLGVVPVRWTGPSLNYDTPKVAIETLEIAHHGILPKAGAA